MEYVLRDSEKNEQNNGFKIDLDALNSFQKDFLYSSDDGSSSHTIIFQSNVDEPDTSVQYIQEIDENDAYQDYTDFTDYQNSEESDADDDYQDYQDYQEYTDYASEDTTTSDKNNFLDKLKQKNRNHLSPEREKFRKRFIDSNNFSRLTNDDYNIVFLSKNHSSDISFTPTVVSNILSRIVSDKNVLIVIDAVNSDREEDVLQIENLADNIFEYGANKVGIHKYMTDNINIFDYDVVYIADGSINILSDMINHSDFRDNIRRYLENECGIVAAEGNAGLLSTENISWIYKLSSHVEDSITNNVASINNFRGLGITAYNIIPHYNTISVQFLDEITKINDAHLFSILLFGDEELFLDKYEPLQQTKKTEEVHSKVKEMLLQEFAKEKQQKEQQEKKQTKDMLEQKLRELEQLKQNK